MPGERVAGSANRVAITVCVILATVMQALDTTIANVALPYMQGSVSATQDQIDWVLTSYIVAAAIMTPPTGFLAGRFGLKRLFLTSVAGFTIASMLCVLVTSTLKPMAVPPCRRISATVSATESSTSQTTTFAPSLANLIAVALPMPLLAPVISATLLESRTLSPFCRYQACERLFTATGNTHAR